MELIEVSELSSCRYYLLIHRRLHIFLLILQCIGKRPIDDIYTISL